MGFIILQSWGAHIKVQSLWILQTFQSHATDLCKGKYHIHIKFLFKLAFLEESLLENQSAGYVKTPGVADKTCQQQSALVSLLMQAAVILQHVSFISSYFSNASYFDCFTHSFLTMATAS